MLTFLLPFALGFLACSLYTHGRGFLADRREAKRVAELREVWRSDVRWATKMRELKRRASRREAM